MTLAMTIPSPAASDHAVVRLHLIGQMEAWTLTRKSVLPPGRKTRALLAIIALSAPRPVLRSRLAEMLWSRRPEEQARASLRQEIHRLLDSLSPARAEIIAVSRDHLGLRSGAAWMDVEEVLRATPNNPASLSLLDGELLEDLDGVDPAFDSWLAVERERLRDGARCVAELLLREQSDPEAAIPAAQRVLAIDRAHEGAWRALMRAYAQRGERGMAIQTYERCRAVLTDLLDAAPSPETQKLLVEIRTGRDALQSAATEAPRSEPRSAGRAGGVKVGVLPLQMIGTDESDGHLSQALAEEITAALARFRWMSLISSTSLARFATQSRDEGAIRRAFGLDFLIDGTVQQAGKRVRVNLRLLDLSADHKVAWSHRVEREALDLLTLQDEIAAEMAAQIDLEVLLSEAQRAAARPLNDACAYDLVLRTVPLIHRLERRGFLEAGELLRRAIGQEPDYAPAHAWYAYHQALLADQDWAEMRAEAITEATRAAERAITLDPQYARGLTIAGHVRAFLGRKPREANVLHERALAVNPSLAMAWGLSATSLTYAAQFEEATRRFERYKALAPLDRYAFFYDGARITLELLKRDYAAAIEIGRRVSELNPGFLAGLRHYLAALGHQGYAEEAEHVRAKLAALDPGFTVQRFLSRSPLERAADTAHYAEGLRRAGLPEGRG